MGQKSKQVVFEELMAWMIPILYMLCFTLFGLDGWVDECVSGLSNVCWIVQGLYEGYDFTSLRLPSRLYWKRSE
jgi:hypothetical protein